MKIIQTCGKISRGDTMEIQGIRETFCEANILIARNGIAVYYPPRDGSIFRNTALIRKGNTAFLQLFKDSMLFRFSIGANDGFRMDFSLDGEELEIEEEMHPLYKPVLLAELGKNTTGNDWNSAFFDYCFDGVSTDDEEDVKRRLGNFLDGIQDNEAFKKADVMSYTRKIKGFSKMIERYLNPYDIEINDGYVRMIFLSDGKCNTWNLIGLPKNIFTEMVELSDIILTYSCGGGSGYISLEFTIG